MTTDDHTCVVLLDDVVLRQVLATRDADERAIILRLNLAAADVAQHAGRMIGRGTPARTPAATATDRARHPSAGRHAAADAARTAPARHRGTVAHDTAA